MTRMTKKDYELVARCFDNLSCELLNAGLYRRLVNDFADKFQQANPKFNKDKFLQACGL